MAVKKRGLGRGLDSLFEDAAQSPEAGVTSLPLREIEPDKDQPRKEFSEESLAELADSIAQHGLLQPIAVRPAPSASGRYRIIAGERRWRAARMAGLTEVPVVIREVSDEQAMELALIENLQREDLDAVEEAFGYQQLIERCGLTQEQAAQKLGKSRSAVTNSLRLLGLPAEALDLLKSGALTAGHAKAVLGLAPDKQAEAARLIAQQGLNVRQAEALCKKLARPAPAPKAAKAPGPALPREVELSLRESLGSEVSVAYKKGRGTLTVHFYSDEQLTAFANLLGKYDKDSEGGPGRKE